MKKRILSILIAAAIVLVLLSACTSGGGGTSNPGENTPSSPDASSPGSSGGDNTSPGGEPEQVVYWIQKFEDWNMEYFQAQTDLYNTLGQRVYHGRYLRSRRSVGRSANSCRCFQHSS